MHRAVTTPEPRGQGSQIDLRAAIACRMPAVHEEGFIRGNEMGNGLFGQRGGLRLEKSPHQGLSS